MTEYGLFNDEGCVEGGFYSLEEAKEALTERYAADDELEVEKVCPYHDGQAADHCLGCFIEEFEDDDDGFED